MANDKNEVLAEGAYALCQKAYKDKDVDLARVYLLNALTHNTELSYLKALVTIVKKTPFGARKEVAQEALNMFSMALFQAPADQVLEIRKLIDEMQEVYDASFAFDGSSLVSESSTTATWGELLDSYSWSALRTNGELGDLSKVQEKGNYLQKLLDVGSLTDSQRKRVEREFRVTVSYAEYLTKETVLASTLSDAEGELAGKKNLQCLSAKVQNAETLLSQLWLLDVEDVIPSEKYRITLTDYAGRIDRLTKAYSHLRGLPIFEELKSKLAEALKDEPGNTKTKSHVLSRWQTVLQDVSGRMQEIQDPDQIAELQKLIRNLGEASERLSRARYAEYQAYCAKQCRGAIKSFDDTNGKVSASDALKYLERWELARIDETLLSPEASGMFHEAKGMLVDKLSRMDRAEYQVKCVTCDKISLEAF